MWLGRGSDVARTCFPRLCTQPGKVKGKKFPAFMADWLLRSQSLQIVKLLLDRNCYMFSRDASFNI